MAQSPHAALDPKSRDAVIPLILLTVRLMENWRSILALATNEEPDTDSTMIVLATVAIGAEKFTRSGLESELQSLTSVMPPGRLNKCTATSIAAATAINRETVRRKVKQLQLAGILSKDDIDGIRVSGDFAARTDVTAVVQRQLDAIARATEQLRSVGILNR